jgi:fructosamine-3-kinase
MALSAPLSEFLNAKLAVKIVDVRPVGGGSINRVYCLHTDKRKLLIKLNEKVTFPDMFKYERDGLHIIGETGAIGVPDVILQDDFEDESFLVLSWVDSRQPTPVSSVLLGKQLAALHRCSAEKFGLTSDNYMGSLKQSNKQHCSWTDFFVEERLMPMVKMATDKQLLSAADDHRFETLYNTLPEFFQEEAPALIHGDLWGGNYLISAEEVPYLIDPAICYGNREFDIAMTMLFGGFLPEFYETYDACFPLLPKWKQRVDLWNLYPLLIHLNLFGGGYLQSVRNNLRSYT